MIIRIILSVHKPTCDRFTIKVKLYWLDLTMTLLGFYFTKEVFIRYDREILKKKKCIVISNHLTNYDWIYIMVVLHSLGMYKDLCIILKESLKKLPIYGYGMRVFGYIFLKRNWSVDREILSEGLNGLKAKDKYFLLLFPEGTFIDKTAHKKSIEFGKKNNIKIDGKEFLPENVLIPRKTGFEMIHDVLKESIDGVIDITLLVSPHHNFPPEEYTIWNIFIKRKYKISLLFLIECIENSDELRDNWIYGNFQRKNNIIESYKQEIIRNPNCCSDIAGFNYFCENNLPESLANYDYKNLYVWSKRSAVIVEIDVILHFVKSHIESSSNSKEIQRKCFCQKKRATTDEEIEFHCIEQMFAESKTTEYKKFVLHDIHRLSLKFEVLDKAKVENSTQQIFLCHHIKKHEIEIFYRFIISYYMFRDDTKIDEFYTILYFLEYFRVKYDNMLKKALMIIFISLSKSKAMKILDLEKMAFHFSKQEIFSHEFFKKISQVFFDLFLPRIESCYRIFSVNEHYLLQKYEMFYTNDRKYLLILKGNCLSSIFRKISSNKTIKNIFIILLNTLDLKYLHLYEVGNNNLKAFIITDKIIISLNTNLNFRNLKRIVMLKPTIQAKKKFSKTLSNIHEFIFYDRSFIITENQIEEEKVFEQLNSIKELINNSQTDKKIQISSFAVNGIGYSEEILSYNPNLYTNLFEGHFLPRKIKIFRFLNLKYKPWEISYSKIYSEFLADIFSLNRIIKFEIVRSDIIIQENIKFRNDSIKKFIFYAKNNENCPYFYEIINSLINLQEMFFWFPRQTDFNFFAPLNLTIRQLNLKTISFHKNFIEQYEFMLLSNLIPSEKVSLWGKCDPGSIKYLCPNKNYCNVKKLFLFPLSIDESDIKALKNLFKLKTLHLGQFDMKNINVSELFCTSIKYDIKQLYINNIVISILDLKFISNLKKLKYLTFDYCDFPTNGILNINISLLMDLNVCICYKKNQKNSEFIRNITETSQDDAIHAKSKTNTSLILDREPGIIIKEKSNIEEEIKEIIEVEE
ncbi:acyltransferase [Hamiltosporidium tvaerminnensis]|uniref:Acyltransferase n=1 Tax=Hamiltosporidium tvaerminnensis TaxID=1176355 RepID=A0A4Q9L4U6_9MICR|nr:acyltransferase [Hamiltosporidium tvaerminnensis]